MHQLHHFKPLYKAYVIAFENTKEDRNARHVSIQDSFNQYRIIYAITMLHSIAQD